MKINHRLTTPDERITAEDVEFLRRLVQMPDVIEFFKKHDCYDGVVGDRDEDFLRVLWIIEKLENQFDAVEVAS